MRSSLYVGSLGWIVLSACSVGRDAPAPIDYGVAAHSQTELERDAQRLKDLEADLADHGVILTAEGWDEEVFAKYVESHADQRVRSLAQRLSALILASEDYQSSYTSFAMNDQLYTVDNLKAVRDHARSARGMLERIQAFPDQSIAVALHPTFSMEQFRQELAQRSKTLQLLVESGFEVVTSGKGPSVQVEINPVQKRALTDAELRTAQDHLEELRVIDTTWIQHYGRYPMNWVREDGELLIVDQKTYVELGLDDAKVMRSQTLIAIERALEKIRKGLDSH